jgi:hypothetical protein
LLGGLKILFLLPRRILIQKRDDVVVRSRSAVAVPIVVFAEQPIERINTVI